MKRIKKKREFSKVISSISIGMWLLVNFYAMVLMAITLDLSPLVYVIGSVDAVVAVVLASYFNKAKLENQIKLQKRNISKEYLEAMKQNAEWE